MNKAVLEAVEREFRNAARPPKIAIDDLGESRLIQRDFGYLDPEHMTYADAANMVIDAALVTDAAITYFLPRLARAAIEQVANAELLQRRLLALDADALSVTQRRAVEDLVDVLREVEHARDRDEAEEIEAGRRAWRRRTTQRGSTGDRLLLAAESGDLEGVRNALNAGADPRYQDELGNTAVELAKMNGHTDVVAVLTHLA